MTNNNICDMKPTLFLILSALLLKATPMSAQDEPQFKNAVEIAPEMYPGWNLGNTLEPGPYDWISNKLDYETVWQDTKTSQAVIDFVKSQGFKSVRIPCSWFVHMDGNYNIDPKWMDRVQEVVDYCIKDSLYVVLNDHYDSGWIEKSFAEQTPDSVDKNSSILGMMWKQIAHRFRDYDHHLLFAGMNEPDAAGDNSKDKDADVNTLKRYHQAFVNAVRQTGGNNKKRTLVVQAPCTNIDLASKYDFLPTDATPHALMLEVHYYSPYNFTMMSKDETWDKQAYYWGEGNHCSGSEHNVKWGEEAAMQHEMVLMNQKYAGKGIPVIMGEFGTLWRVMPEGENQELHDASVRSWHKTLCYNAVRNGVIPFVWDTNFCQRPSMGILNRKTLTVFNPIALEAIMEGCREATWPASVSVSAP